MAGTCGESVRSAWTNNFRAQAERPAQIMCSIGGPWLAVLSLDPRSDQQLSSIWIPSMARVVYTSLLLLLLSNCYVLPWCVW
jgi:hypothetical protein